MTSQAQSGPAIPKDEKKGLGKLLSRTKTLFRGSNKRESAQPAGTSSMAIQAKSDPLASLDTRNAKSHPAPAMASPLEVSTKDVKKGKYDDLEGLTRVTKQDLFEERARKLGEKYGLEIKKSEWYSTEGTALRVEKPIRMRVHRTCASCSATFNSAKECPSCGSTKYKRYPPKRTEAEKMASRERRAALIKANKENAPIVPDYRHDTKKETVLTKPNKSGGPDLVHKKPRQRVRRTCHECHTLFATASKKCSQCQHARCTDCPRDPPKKDKYPFGYPGDEFGPSAVPHHECIQCKTIFAGGAPDGTPCKKCDRPKDEACPRLKPRKVEPDPDPVLLESIHAKIAALKLG